MTSGKPTIQSGAKSIHKDMRFLLDEASLNKATSSAAFSSGKNQFEHEQVLEHYTEQGILYGVIEDECNSVPYQLSIIAGPTGMLSSDCECPNKSDMLCSHAVATLLAYNAPDEEGGMLGTAKDTAIRDRIKRGHNEVKVTHISGEPDFGIWQAQSLTSTTGRAVKYRVEIRSTFERINDCNCPDLANNQLGTCKHIEAVLHQIGKMAKKAHTIQPKPFVYRSHGEDGGIWAQRTTNMSQRAKDLIDQYFDVQGRFNAAMPKALFELCDALFGFDDVLLCEDAKQFAEQQLKTQKHQQNGEQIRQAILATDGQLPHINAKLYPYQLEGVAFLASLGRALLADDMGLGKTLQSIAAACYLMQNSGVKRILVICPASLKHQWAREIKRFSGYDCQIVQGNVQQRRHQYRRQSSFFVLNYELAVRDLDDINKTLKPDLLILDEAQRIKNWRTKVASAIKAINSEYAFVLTGTPIENKLEELYSLMQVVDQNVLGPLWRYLNDYHVIDEKGKILGYRNLTELRARIAKTMLRRNRSVVAAQLPERTTLRLDVPMSTKQQTLHDEAMATAAQYAAIARQKALSPAQSNALMAALQQARMACDAAGLVDKQTKGSPKLNELKNLIEQLCIDGGQKMVVFSQWKMMTSQVAALLEQMGIGYAHLHGQVAPAKRGELLKRFEEDELCQVFVSTDAGGSGLNLQTASVLVNLDIPFNPAVLQQRNARVHRLGQARQVQIILMIAESSYEQQVYQLLCNKQDLFDNVIDPEGTEDSLVIGKQALAKVIDTLTLDSAGLAKLNSEPTPLPPSQTPIELNKCDAANNSIKQLLHAFGARLKGIYQLEKGLLVAVSDYHQDDQYMLAQLAVDPTLALVDAQSLDQLKQLGCLNNACLAQPYSIELDKPQKRWQLWREQAQQHFHQAQCLLTEKKSGAVINQMCDGIAATLSAVAKLDSLIAIDSIPNWAFDTAIQRKWLTVQQANVVSRVIALRQANIIGEKILSQSLNEAKVLKQQLLDGID